MNRNRVASILVLPVLALSACGGGGDGGNSDEDQIRDVVEESAKTPSKLCENLAAAPLKAVGGKDKCLEAAKEQKGADVKIESVSVNGDRATVKGTGSGSNSGEITLVKEDGDWKITITA